MESEELETLFKKFKKQSVVKSSKP
jgi:hypothetical protein